MAFEHSQLLSPPIARAAYSDRTSWIMAEMSRLAYEKFEGSDVRLDGLVRQLANERDAERIRTAVLAFASEYGRPSGQGLADLEAGLGKAGFRLVDTFNSEGTQGFLAARDSDKLAVLAFRGTEKNYKDIKTDLNARFYTRAGTRVHDGFRTAFEHVEANVKKAVSSLKDYKLYVTGHSLGGALAIVCTRALNADFVAACYTFGSPRVGDIEFATAIKVPVYRVINAADVVPRLPPTWGIELVILAAKFLPVPLLRAWLIKWLEGFRGYRDIGDVRYLTECQDDFSDLKLISNPGLLDRLPGFLARFLRNWKAPFLDHRIAQYCEKLGAYGLKRL